VNILKLLIFKKQVFKDFFKTVLNFFYEKSSKEQYSEKKEKKKKYHLRGTIENIQK